jgi:hypothetical protein
VQLVDEPLASQKQAKEAIVTMREHSAGFENRTPRRVIPSCDWVRVENGKIKEIQSFYDRVKVREVLSPNEQQKLGDSY